MRYMTARTHPYRLPHGIRQARFNLDEDLIEEMDTAVAALALDSRIELVRRAVGEFLHRHRKVIAAYRRIRRGRR